VLAGIVAAVFAAWFLMGRGLTESNIVGTGKALTSYDVFGTIFGVMGAAVLLTYCGAVALVGYVTYRVCLVIFKG
jgi:hypothetical protein